MKITDIKTFLVDATPPGGWGGGGRNWLFIKVETDEGIVGYGEASGWPRVIQTAVEDFKTILIGQDPGRIELLWQKMLLGMMGHGMTGVVGAGAMTGVEVALWDILGKKLGVPVVDLLGGRCRERVRVYAHASEPQRALQLVEAGYTALKCGGLRHPVRTVRRLREALPDEIDLCIDVHGPPWFTVPDAIRVGQELEEYDLLFYEDPVPPENLDALAKVSESLSLPVAAGERSSTIYGCRELIEREIVDVLQPDMGRVGGIYQMKKIAAQAEAHHIMMAPHDGSNGPLCEAAAVHVMASVPNFLILEHRADDVPWRYELVTELPVVDGAIEVPRRPGLGVEFNEDVARAHPGVPNVAAVTPANLERMYVEARSQRRRLFQE
ncbi:MAG TPA: mandelate racemase/muconate lactonizing enzyme family protein [Chloroflexota bacterium]|jgi:galactonate dehydratase|nr:mandelate racemase/muconate lactonizing enzyme family protein [Chloroflexota bacterium]